MIKFQHVAIAAALMAPFGAVSAAATFVITETYVGISGEDGTNDWIEVTNVGDMSGDTSSLYYDDESADAAAAGKLDSFILSPGESAIFLIADDLADAIKDEDNFTDPFNEFDSIWGAGINVGLTNGGGGLSQNGDTAFIGEIIGGSIFSPVDSLAYDASDLSNGGVNTLEQVLGNAVVESITGVNGAYSSNSFFNDNIGAATGNSIALVGSPGVAPVPVPAMLPAFVLALVGLYRLRRK